MTPTIAELTKTKPADIEPRVSISRVFPQPSKSGIPYRDFPPFLSKRNGELLVFRIMFLLFFLSEKERTKEILARPKRTAMVTQALCLCDSTGEGLWRFQCSKQHSMESQAVFDTTLPHRLRSRDEVIKMVHTRCNQPPKSQAVWGGETISALRFRCFPTEIKMPRIEIAGSFCLVQPRLRVAISASFSFRPFSFGRAKENGH